MPETTLFFLTIATIFLVFERDPLSHLYRLTRYRLKSIIYRLIGKKMLKLPKISDGRVDRNRVKNVVRCNVSGADCLMMIIDGNPVWTRYDPDILSLLQASGIAVNEQIELEEIEKERSDDSVENVKDAPPAEPPASPKKFKK